MRPEPQVRGPQNGIDANPEECICWLEDCSPEIQDMVQSAVAIR